MATAVTPGEEEKGRKGRRSRARARAEALAETAVPVPVAEAVPVAPAADQQPGSPLAAAVLARRRRKQSAAVAAAALAPPAPFSSDVVESEPAPEVSEIEPFHDLLGQAIGLRLDAVTREFDTGEMKVAALREVSLEIGPGEFVAVIGPSGCGKTTLLSMMGGLDQPTTGQVYAAGVALDQLSDEALADYRLQRVSTIFQTFNLVPGMSAEENVILPLTLAGVEPEERRSRARRLLELVGLEGRSRMRARDTLRLGLRSAGRRPLRTFLTTTGVAIGIAAMSLIVALSGGLDYALAAPAFAHAKTDVIAVRPASDSTSAAFDAQSLNTMASLPHVQSAWGQVSVNGSFTGADGTTGGANDPLIALAPRAQWDGSVRLIAGSMPTSDAAQQVVLSAREAVAPGLTNTRGAIGTPGPFQAPR